MAYASMFTGLGVQKLPLDRVWPVVVAGLGLSLALTGYRAWRRGRMGRFSVAMLGASVLVLTRWADLRGAWPMVGLAILAVGLTWTRWGLRRRAVQS